MPFKLGFDMQFMLVTQVLSKHILTIADSKCTNIEQIVQVPLSVLLSSLAVTTLKSLVYFCCIAVHLYTFACK